MATRTIAIGVLVVALGSTLARAAAADDEGGGAGGEPRPQVSALRLSEADVLARFTPEVQGRRELRDRALALWRAHFAGDADAVRRRFLVEADWRPALADAGALIEEFLETSLLPRAGAWPADEAGAVWIEILDSATGQRTRRLAPAPQRPHVFAPVDEVQPKQGNEGDGLLLHGGSLLHRPVPVRAKEGPALGPRR